LDLEALMRADKWTGMVVAGMLALAACGGGQKTSESTTPSGEGDDEATSGGEGGGAQPDPDALDELTRVFNNKRPAVSRCYNDAVQSGKLDKKAKGRITVALTISAAGKAQAVKTAQDTLKSPDVETCVLALIKSWDLPEPGASTEFSFSYDFEPE
jgi:hypothetical protein